jgi:hypothetical protein
MKAQVAANGYIARCGRHGPMTAGRAVRQMAVATEVRERQNQT